MRINIYCLIRMTHNVLTKNKNISQRLRTNITHHFNWAMMATSCEDSDV